jgi:hypothetical protein
LEVIGLKYVNMLAGWLNGTAYAAINQGGIDGKKS